MVTGNSIVVMCAKLPAVIVAVAPAKHLCCAAAVDQMGKASPASLLDGHQHEQALDLELVKQWEGKAVGPRLLVSSSAA